MIEIIGFILLVALLAAFIILLLKKLGVVEWMQVHGDHLTSQLFSCDFCMSFWTAFLVSIGFCFLFGNEDMLMIPFFSTPLTRYLL